MYREDVIIPLITGRDVLDCGGIDHWAMEMKQQQGTWLHSIIHKYAKSVIGIDILEASVQRINSQGRYQFLVGNVETLPFVQQFDVVIAGEIVEHIYNMGLFLDSTWKSLKSDGILICTTPNNYALSSSIYSGIFNVERCHPEHTCYYSKQTLSYIIAKHGFSVEATYMMSRPSSSPVVGIFRKMITKLRPLLAEQLVIIAKKTA